MSQYLSETENALLGGCAGVIEVSMLQSLNYWKNMSQQRLPFTMDPRKTYRGFLANCLNMGGVTCFQFAVAGSIKKVFTGGTNRSLKDSEQFYAGFGAGFASGFVCSPLELTMIQQQRKGGSFVSTFGRLIGQGQIFRGLINTSLREGIYTAGYLGVAPVVREYLTKNFSTSIGKNEDSARMFGAVVGGLFASGLSHPMDTAKTCMQGDVERKKYTGFVATYKTLYQEGQSIAVFYRGVGWRLTRHILACFILDKARFALGPILFPKKFRDIK